MSAFDVLRADVHAITEVYPEVKRLFDAPDDDFGATNRWMNKALAIRRGLDDQQMLDVRRRADGITRPQLPPRLTRPQLPPRLTRPQLPPRLTRPRFTRAEYAQCLSRNRGDDERLAKSLGTLTKHAAQIRALEPQPIGRQIELARLAIGAAIDAGQVDVHAAALADLKLRAFASRQLHRARGF